MQLKDVPAVASEAFVCLYLVTTALGNFLALRENPRLSAIGQALIKFAAELSVVKKTIGMRREQARRARLRAATAAGIDFDDLTPIDPPGGE